MRTLLAWLRDILFPRRCMLCRRFLEKNETDLCRSCFHCVPEYPSSGQNRRANAKNTAHFLDSFTAVWYYEGDVRRSILRFKFRRAVHLAPRFGRFLAMRLAREGMSRCDILTWVPISRRRRFQRGFDQCRLLAQSAGAQLEIPVKMTLRKIRNNPPQSTLSDASMRKANVLGVYRVCGDVRGKTVLLVDDIYTTGSTMNECARMLLTAGAKEVHGAALAAVRNQKRTK